MPLSPAPIQDPILIETGRMPQTWQRFFSQITSLLARVNNDGSYSPPSLADSVAANNSIYYSTTVNKLVYKDAGGTVNVLY